MRSGSGSSTPGGPGGHLRPGLPGAHFSVYHLATEGNSQYSFVGPNATDLHVLVLVLTALQVIALVFAAATIAWLVRRSRRRPTWRTVAWLAGLLGGWLVPAAALTSIPEAVYTAASVNPNAEVRQAKSIDNYLTASRSPGTCRRRQPAERGQLTLRDGDHTDASAGELRR